ncbi:hypothetical protein [Miniphocaeibacter halophilus]|uniref:Uncharacterized protein n=1 Tax=Miniphocaeibacter halophilus TaxID=2931922 RepID=A0AC61MWY7_9FIRM|nr:hypothetical protein [Miniphocaeibacter halophilus]QQK08819.1 hypothetical protein JFY71_04605 [Miniphocaeibacter halophilus]
MMEKMFNIMDTSCDKANSALGVNIKFPRPSKRQLKATQLLNITTGAACIVAGVVTPYKKIAILGGLSLLGACVVGSQLKNFD